MKKILLIALILTLSACVTTQPPTPTVYSSDFNGTWEGVGKQSNDQKWSIIIKISNGNYLIEYPSLGCSGKLTLISNKNSAMTLNEKITAGKGRCVDNGIVTIIRDSESKIQFVWYYPNGKKGADGVLVRKSTI